MTKDINILKIKNLDHFLNYPSNNTDRYKSKFRILSDLEEEIKYQSNPDPTIMIVYKDFGFYIFVLLKIYIDDNGYRIVEYEFETTIS